MSLYLFLDLIALLFPFIFSFHKKLRFYREWKFILPSILITASVFIIWDIIFTRNGIWGFNDLYLSGIYLWDLPLEEYLFFICIPYASVFTCYSFQYLFPSFKLKDVYIKGISSLVFIICIITAILFYDRWYTFITACFAALILAITYKIAFNVLNYFYLTFPFILIPFFLINGILTGSFIEGEVVWYNNTENLGLRMFTIPVEDLFYAFAMILCIIMLSELMKRRFRD